MASPFTSTNAPGPAAGGLGTTAPLADPGVAARPDRPLGRRPSLPGGRAIVGAALVVAAAVMTYAAYLGATEAPSQTFVVAQRELRANDRVTAADFRVVTGELPADVQRQAFTSPAELDGARVLAPIGANALVNRSAVLAGGGQGPATDAYEVSFTVANWKLGGRLQANELIDLVPTGDARDPARVPPPAVRDVRVIALDNGRAGALGSAAADAVVTVAAPDPLAYQAIVNVVRGEFWVVRSTRVAGPGPTGPSVSPATAPLPTTTVAGPAALPSFPASTGPATTRRP